MELNLDGRTALITGASMGIGEHIAETLAAEGVNLHLTARSADKLEDLKARIIGSHNVSVTLHPFDLMTQGTPKKLAQAITDVDILVNNAGAIPSGDLWDVDEDAWRAGFDLKVFGYINMCRLFYTKMKDAGGGVIINIIGNGGEVLDRDYIAGATGNISLMGFTRALGGYALDDNMRVVGINPGPVNTDRIYNMLKKWAEKDLGDAERYQELASGYPLGRPAHCSEISDLVAFLASDRAGYTTGTVYTVDGGISARTSIV
ncbi:NAD(P)-dependent dehydrogenase, short-chain alcohol dehydrogenase family [Ruegeria halocynthiae]|uniref:NAD(P)-dependent dehydrogenase, short-chain alcohol dehydrogenase family n=1 Tax=Ruegeria halocynthiae TaxID=985054 RepID=A0A1H3D726_9RHOB|nr:short-chain dehydrogenase/reductase [Ruegeria halocynthiae]SDX62136.1 NAD(P)-dependent dehydrogenase, short-chain alcohol dehydrogenase family [Ruegeria halocynthiae]